MKDCPYCDNGRIKYTHIDKDGKEHTKSMKCDFCNGTGRVKDYDK